MCAIRESSNCYLSLFGGRCAMGLNYKSGSLWNGLKWRQTDELRSFTVLVRMCKIEMFKENASML